MGKWGEVDPYPGRMKKRRILYIIVHVHVCLLVLPTRRDNEVMPDKVHVFCDPKTCVPIPVARAPCRHRFLLLRELRAV